MRVSRQPGYTLHTRPYRESSLLIDILSRNHGRTTLLAKGIRNLKSRNRSATIPFSLLSLGWSGKGELPVLTQAEHDGPVNLLSGLERVCGFYANELLVRLLHKHDPHPALFDAYDVLLGALGKSGNVEISLRFFEKNLLRELGYALDLEREADGSAPVIAEARYQYVPTYGVVRVGDEGSGALTVSGATLLALSREELDDKNNIEECKYLMRGIIGHHLGRHQLRSRSLLGAFKI
jgi:DNA repair protein RecO (recombination protein O)